MKCPDCGRTCVPPESKRPFCPACGTEPFTRKRKEPPVNTQDVMFYGCWERTGHYLVDSKGHHLNHIYDKMPFKMIDAGFLAGVPDDGTNQGHVHVTRIGTRWTILSFWDRTIDERPGSNGNFIIPGYFSYEDAMGYAKLAFPNIFARFNKHDRALVRAHYDGFEYPEANTSA